MTKNLSSTAVVIGALRAKMCFFRFILVILVSGESDRCKHIFMNFFTINLFLSDRKHICIGN